MREARSRLGMRQLDLATKLRANQSTISDIEQGNTATSDLVLPICKILGINPPNLDSEEDELTQRWRRLEHVIRARSPQVAEQILDLMETFANELEKK